MPDGNLTPFTSVVSLICTLTHSTGISLGFFELLIIFSTMLVDSSMFSLIKLSFAEFSSIKA